MELIDVVNRLVGPITPVADSAIDGVRMENLKAYCDLTEQMCLNIYSISKDRHSQFASMKGIGEQAYKFLMQLKEFIPEPPKPSHNG